MARGGQWRRSNRGLYVPATADPTLPEQRIIEAAAVLRPGGGALTGWAAVCWSGGRWFTGTTAYGVPRPVCLAADKVRPQPGIVITEERLDPRTVVVHDGLAITDAVSSVVYEMRHAESEVEAAVCWEMAAYDDLVDHGGTLRALGFLDGRTGVRQARAALAWVDENSWSPWETRMKGIWIFVAGLPRPLCNQPVFDRLGRHLITPDLLDPEAGMVGEYDGEMHAQANRRRSDRDRAALCRELGLELVVMMRGDAADPARVAARMHAARGRAASAAESTRAWTIHPPPWWTPTGTVAQRRALSRGQRAGFLRYRRVN
ncbi:hypothetical protein GCM10027020_35930 [Nocardioides salsibiostraticola]